MAARQEGNLHKAAQLLAQAKQHLSKDDCTRGCFALEEARLDRDSGRAEDAVTALATFYEEYLIKCDGDTQVIAMQIAAEIAWGHFVAGSWSDAQQWFHKACCQVSLMPNGCCTLLSAAIHAGLAASHLHSSCAMVTEPTTDQLIKTAKQHLQDSQVCVVDCQAARIYLAVCCTLTLSGCDQAQEQFDKGMQHSPCNEQHPYNAACRDIFNRALQSSSVS